MPVGPAPCGIGQLPGLRAGRARVPAATGRFAIVLHADQTSVAPTSAITLSSPPPAPTTPPPASSSPGLPPPVRDGLDQARRVMTTSTCTASETITRRSMLLPAPAQPPGPSTSCCSTRGEGSSAASATAAAGGRCTRELRPGHFYVAIRSPHEQHRRVHAPARVAHDHHQPGARQRRGQHDPRAPDSRRRSRVLTRPPVDGPATVTSRAVRPTRRLAVRPHACTPTAQRWGGERPVGRRRPSGAGARPPPTTGRARSRRARRGS